MPTWKHYLLTFSILLLAFAKGQSQTFYKTPSGAKYHLGNCRMVKNVSEEISIRQAMKAGLLPCKFCNPQNIYPAIASPTNKPKGQSNTVQCKGFTKTGTRCKHMTSIANGYCFQHNPDKQ